MNTLTIQIKNQNDYHLLNNLMKRLNINVIDHTSTISNQKKEILLKAIEAGGDGKSTANPIPVKQKLVREIDKAPEKTIMQLYRYLQSFKRVKIHQRVVKNSEEEWQQFATMEFLRGYAKSDEIYDKL